MNNEEGWCMESAQANAGIVRGGCPCLNASHEQPIYLSDRKGHNGMTDDGTATTLNAQEKEHPMIARSIVRRLTPTECMRLQGYPDGWLAIGEERVVRKSDYKTEWVETENSRWPTDEEWETDERLYDDDGNLDLSAYGFKKKRKKIGSHQEIVTVWVDENGKSHEEADTAKYKAAGNSIALPFWSWLWRRIAAQYERQATMGSLFDGIGGFPLTALRSGIKPLWASEIESFPIAVCKKHFGDEDAGIEGDVMDFL